MAKTNEKAIDPAIEAKKAARKAALARIRAFVSANVENLGPIAKDLNMVLGSGTRGPRTAGSTRTVNTELRDAFISAGDKGLSEIELFKRFKIGRPEMVGKCRVLVLCPNPSDRLWVKFNEADETYYVEGKGENPPEDWEGYVPSAKALGL